MLIQYSTSIHFGLKGPGPGDATDEMFSLLQCQEHVNGTNRHTAHSGIVIQIPMILVSAVQHGTTRSRAEAATNS